MKTTAKITTAKKPNSPFSLYLVVSRAAGATWYSGSNIFLTFHGFYMASKLLSLCYIVYTGHHKYSDCFRGPPAWLHHCHLVVAVVMAVKVEWRWRKWVWGFSLSEAVIIKTKALLLRINIFLGADCCHKRE